jgi:hypothetical protein
VALRICASLGVLITIVPGLTLVGLGLFVVIAIFSAHGLLCGGVGACVRSCGGGRGCGKINQRN